MGVLDMHFARSQHLDLYKDVRCPARQK
jgi:hypothetical protein